MKEAIKEILIGAIAILVFLSGIVVVTGFTLAPVFITIATNNGYWLWYLLITAPLGISMAIYAINRM